MLINKLSRLPVVAHLVMAQSGSLILGDAVSLHQSLLDFP